jgi:hypothetical protein
VQEAREDTQSLPMAGEYSQAAEQPVMNTDISLDADNKVPPSVANSAGIMTVKPAPKTPRMPKDSPLKRGRAEANASDSLDMDTVEETDVNPLSSPPRQKKQKYSWTGTEVDILRHVVRKEKEAGEEVAKKRVDSVIEFPSARKRLGDDEGRTMRVWKKAKIENARSRKDKVMTGREKVLMVSCPHHVRDRQTGR